MLQTFFQIYFIFLLCVLIEVKDGISQEHSVGEMAILNDIRPRRRSTANNCTCSEIPEWSGVVCENSDSEPKFPILNINTSKCLRGKRLRIYSVILNDSDVKFSKNFLQGFLGLKEKRVKHHPDEVMATTSASCFIMVDFSQNGCLHFHALGFYVLPDPRIVKDSFTHLEIGSSRLRSLQERYRNRLTSVRFLYLTTNSIRNIEPWSFWGAHNVQFVYFSHKKLTSIPPKLLDPMWRIILFTADRNKFLSVDKYFYIRLPQGINLVFNNKTNFSLPQNSLFGFNISTLDLSYNLTKETSFPLYRCNRNQDSILKIIDLIVNGNKLLNYKICLGCLHRITLEIIGNQIQLLTENDFISYPLTYKIVLRENEIGRIDTDTFASFYYSLQVLDLSCNKIASVNGSMKYLSELRLLNLSHNSIQVFAKEDFTGLDSLSSLFLEHNQIKSLGTLLQILKNLHVLNIAHNDIKIIKSNQISNNLQHIYLAGNPLINNSSTENIAKCDCKNVPFFDMLLNSENGVCLKSEHENNVLKHLNCPDACSCKCTKIGDGFSIFVDCSSRKLSFVPHFVRNHSPELEVDEVFSSDERRYHIMYQNYDSSLHIEGEVLGINLENNSLGFLDAAQLPPNLVQLYLSNNKLDRFPKSVMDSQLNLKEVSLSGNPWKCDCDALEFKKWVASHNQIIKDFENVRCGITDIGKTNVNGSVIWSLEDSDLCPVTDFVKIFSVFSLSFAIICIVARKIYRKHELSIKVSLYSHGFHFVKEKVFDHQKAFDAFISFSHKDDKFIIEDIVSEIEKRDPNIRLCLHYRHFRPGEPIVNNIAHAVQQSSITVLMLSRNFLESEWCILEFKSAVLQTLQDKAHRIVAVKIGEIPKEIDPTIKLYLDSTTYLTWGERNYWNKLLFILPSQSNDERRSLRFVGDYETGFNFSSSNV